MKSTLTDTTESSDSEKLYVLGWTYILGHVPLADMEFQSCFTTQTDMFLCWIQCIILYHVFLPHFEFEWETKIGFVGPSLLYKTSYGSTLRNVAILNSMTERWIGMRKCFYQNDRREKFYKTYQEKFFSKTLCFCGWLPMESPSIWMLRKGWLFESIYF